MSSAPITSIVVTYHSAGVIGEALRAARRCHEAGLLDCIVVDNASGDDTVARVRREHPWAQVIASPQNLGYGRGCNLGLRAARSELVLFMNADAVLEPDGLAALLGFMTEHPRAAMVAPALLSGDGHHQEAGGLPTPWEVLRKAAGFWRPHPRRREVTPGGPAFQTDWICGAMMLARHSVMEELGGFDERFFLYFEETDLCRRVGAAGYELWAVGAAVARHVGGDSAKAGGARLTDGCVSDHFFRSRFYYMAKHYGYPAAAVADVGEIACLAAWALPRRLLGRSRGQFLARLRAPILKPPAAVLSPERTMTLGIVVIGRNEGERLARCLDSVAAADGAVVYVDSGSTDASVALARSKGAEVVDLDRSTGFSAARARNAGFARLREVAPAAAWVQFVDGDCEVRAGWLERARQELAARADLAITCGRLRERFPEASVYNRLCDMEWDGPAGEVRSCGGNFMARVEALAAVGGFNPGIVAGEEPELCSRLRQKGWKVLRIDAEMALHDAAMARLAQWWRREQRNGYGGLDVSRRFPQARADGLFVGQVRSARRWTLGWAGVLVLATVGAGALAGPVAALAAAAVVLLMPPMQALRLAWRVRRRVPLRAALAYGGLTLVGKWAQLVGQLRWWRDRRLARVAPLIEYKAPPTDAVLQPQAPTHGQRP